MYRCGMHGEWQSIKQACMEAGQPYDLVMQRLHAGLVPEGSPGHAQRGARVPEGHRATAPAAQLRCRHSALPGGTPRGSPAARGEVWLE
jgi:hypothetical protein